MKFAWFVFTAACLGWLAVALSIGCANDPLVYCGDHPCDPSTVPICTDVVFAQYCDATESFGPCQRQDGSPVAGCKIAVVATVPSTQFQLCTAGCQ